MTAKYFNRHKGNLIKNENGLPLQKGGHFVVRSVKGLGATGQKFGRLRNAAFFPFAVFALTIPAYARDLPYRMGHDGIPYVGDHAPRNRIGCGYDPIKNKGVCKSPGSGMIYLEDPDMVPKGFAPAGCGMIDPGNEGLGWSCSPRERRR